MADQEPRTILVAKDGKVLRLTMNRPQVHNAFNAAMIRELAVAFDEAKKDSDVRLVVLTGAGESFCAGADLNWMREIIRYSYEQNLRESRELAELMYAIYTLPKPTIARINGAVIGGGTGLFSACDIVIASDRAKFGLSEVKIGLIPAAIGPYVIRRIGESASRELFLTGERFDAHRALEIGLVNKVVAHEALDDRVEEVVRLLLSSGPEALAKCKELLQRVPAMSLDEAKGYTAEMIAGLRVSPEGQEGMAAFLEKRKPKWAKD
ncbi:MAG: enoyl-CoA hydratase [Candidatus Aminicenantes bacterium RBG_19FT_COMBO_58_17]|nr:MAG: enoyl-CoA hydratase [Candidatus Aminicenantes bacterium RBG_19FT_COMBO_58_17]